MLPSKSDQQKLESWYRNNMKKLANDPPARNRFKNKYYSFIFGMNRELYNKIIKSESPYNDS